MILFDFDYARPDTVQEALALLGRLGRDARALAGGTDLLPQMRAKLVEPGLLVSLRGIAPEPPTLLPDGSVRIDALSRLADLADSELVARAVPMLVESAMAVGSNQIRQMGTLGGNLCQENRCLYLDQKHDYQFVARCYKLGGECCYPFPRNKRDTCWSVYMSDIAPALIALDATIEIQSEAGTRSIRAEALFTGDGIKPLRLGESELVRAVSIPPAGTGSGWAFHKSTVRGGLEFGMAVIAVMLQLEEDDRTCRASRIVIGAVREGPVRLSQAESALAGAVLDEPHLAKVAAAASQEANPLPHHGASRRYLMDNIRVYLRRALTRALERARRQRTAEPIA